LIPKKSSDFQELAPCPRTIIRLYEKIIYK